MRRFGGPAGRGLQVVTEEVVTEEVLVDWAPLQAAQQAGSLGAEWHHQWQQPYPQQAQQAAVPAPPCGRQQPSAQCGRLTLGLQLQHPTQPQRRVGQLDVEVRQSAFVVAKPETLV